jgi:hypothetical protein
MTRPAQAIRLTVFIKSPESNGVKQCGYRVV